MNRREFLLLLNSAVTAPSALHAQQRAVPVLGFLNGTSPGPAAPFVAAFRQDLGKPATSRDKTWRSNTAGPRAIMIGCPDWPPNSSAARSM